MRNIIFIILIIGALIFGIYYFQNDKKSASDFSSPEDTFEYLMESSRAEDFSLSDLAYTKEFQEFMKTDADYLAHRNTGQLRNQYNIYNNIKYTIKSYGNRAIIRFVEGFSQPSPLYFILENNQWKIDGMFMFDHVRISNDGTWFYQPDNSEELWLEQKL